VFETPLLPITKPTCVISTNTSIIPIVDKEKPRYHVHTETSAGGCLGHAIEFLYPKPNGESRILFLLKHTGTDTSMPVAPQPAVGEAGHAVVLRGPFSSLFRAWLDEGWRALDLL
jgi:hypothetical protein